MLCRNVNIHLLNLLDASPHKLPICKVLSLSLELVDGLLVMAKHISSSRVVLVIESVGLAERYTKLIAWDWRTGEVVGAFFCFRGKLVFTPTQVLEHSSDDPRFGHEIACISEVHLLEETWLLASLNPHPNPQLLVFNTLLPPQDPRSWRILELIRIHPYERYSFPPRCGDPPTADFPEFSVDPAQKMFVLCLDIHEQSAFAVPVE